MELKQKDVNLLVPLKKKPAMPPEQKRKLQLIAIPVLLAALFLAASGSFFLQAMSQRKGVREIEDYERQVEAQWNQAKEVEAKIGSAQNMLSTIKGAETNMKTYPTLQRQVLETAKGSLQGGMSITGMTFTEEGVFTITCSTGNVDSIPPYIDALKAATVFDSVSYYGFKGSKTEGYTFTVTVIPKAGDTAQ